MQFRIESYFNPYLAAGTNRVDAILTVAAEGEGAVSSKPNACIALILDVSGSMQGARIDSVKHATCKAIQLLDETSSFFVVAFSDRAGLVSGLLPATPANKAAAQQQVLRLEARGGTMMSRGLDTARNEFLRMPGAIHYALFLTDGKNSENDDVTLETVLEQCEGVFQCDCRGVGTDWQPRQLQKISSKLLGTAQIIAEPAGVEADFRAAIQNAASRSIGDVRLRLWTPKSAHILSVKQMSPDITMLTDRAAQVDAQTRDYPTGAWSQESRDYYVAMEMTAGEIGDEMLACRASIVYSDGGQEVKIQARPIVAAWTDDEALSTRINPQVAHYTGQEELAVAIQQGLEARATGDEESATRLLGKAAKLAKESGNEETTRRLSKVVDIVDAQEGTVRLKSRIDKADEMDLDLSSTRTARARRPNP